MLNSITMPGLIKQNHGLYAADIDGQAPHAVGEGDGVRVRYPQPVAIQPGDEYQVTADLLQNGRLCMSPGSTEFFTVGPTLSLTAQGLSGDVVTQPGPWSLGGNKFSSCDK
jgi:hypothetical protein